MSIRKWLNKIIRRRKGKTTKPAPPNQTLMEYQIRPEDINDQGYVVLDRLPAELDFQTKLETAVQYFNARKAWGVIGASWSSGPGRLYRPITLQGYFQLNGNFASKDFRQKPSIYIDINDPEAYVFTLVAKKDNGISYADGQRFQNMHIELTDKADIKGVIHTRNAAGQVYQNLAIGNRGGKMKYGIHIGGYSNKAGRAVNTQFHGITIRGASEAGIFLDGVGNNHFFYDVGVMKSAKGIVAHNAAELFIFGRQFEGNCEPLTGEDRVCNSMDFKRVQRIGIFYTYFEEGNISFEDVLQFKMELCKETNAVLDIGTGCGTFDFHLNRWDAFTMHFDQEDYPFLKFTQNHSHNQKFYDRLKENYPGASDPEKFKFWGNIIKPVRFPPEQ